MFYSIDKEDFANECLNHLSQIMTTIELPYYSNMKRMHFIVSYDVDKIRDSDIIEFTIKFNNLQPWRCKFNYEDGLDAETMAKKIRSEFNEWLAEDGYAKLT